MNCLAGTYTRIVYLLGSFGDEKVDENKTSF